MGCGGSADTGAYAREEEKARQQEISSGMRAINEKFAAFDPAFFQQRAEAYKNFAMPTLNQEYDVASDALASKLADQGLLQSSGARYLQTSLSRELQKQRQGVVDAGVQQAQELQKDVESQRQNLVGQLNVSANPSEAAQGALRAVSSLSAPSAMAPVGGFLENWSRLYLADKLNQQASSGRTAPNYGFSLAQTPITSGSR